MLITPFFFVLLLSAPSAIADSRADSWYRIGHEYSQRKRNDDAFLWMMRAAEAGHSAAQNNIGLSYLHGLGVKQDDKEAFAWFEKSAKQGLTYAQSELAMLYYRHGDTKKARQWWLIAANANDEYAQFNLASLFLEQNNSKQATYWFDKARKNKHPQAQTALDKLGENNE
ncbi:tetratricopeptide repeat protein [Bathymodiolus heckerae thiotrophic gill symbiont]|uniref:tetratricopeptide repeat protein n=1 Tax=Bathymodiolus heckerae thiotrophic gill symbiont TaxID=1052212 RepID=UPI001485381C|nr:tetratricopeptide repeat protein [Bathymodiolus heckerae thiotrophic gill symbiont]